MSTYFRLPEGKYVLCDTSALSWEFDSLDPSSRIMAEDHEVFCVQGLWAVLACVNPFRDKDTVAGTIYHGTGILADDAACPGTHFGVVDVRLCRPDAIKGLTVVEGPIDLIAEADMWMEVQGRDRILHFRSKKTEVEYGPDPFSRNNWKMFWMLGNKRRDDLLAAYHAWRKYSDGESSFGYWLDSAWNLGKIPKSERESAGKTSCGDPVMDAIAARYDWQWMTKRITDDGDAFFERLGLHMGDETTTLPRM